MAIESPTVTPALRVPLNGYAMQLRPSELESVATGLRHFDAATAVGPIGLTEAVRRLPVNDRAPAWELAVRRFGRRKELERAAGEIGMDLVHARELLAAFAHWMAAAPSPEPELEPEPKPDQTPSQTL